MTEKVQFVVTSEGWHDSFEDVRYGFSFLSPPAGICGHGFQRWGQCVPAVSLSVFVILTAFEGRVVISRSTVSFEAPRLQPSADTEVVEGENNSPGHLFLS